MLRFIVQRHTIEFGPGIDRRDHFTVDVEVPALEAMLRQGGSGEGGFESWQLLGVEVLTPEAGRDG